MNFLVEENTCIQVQGNLREKNSISQGSKQVQFFPQIETLRAIAVFMVMMAHFIPEENFYYVPFMWYGVDLFFTISGFLITYIFLKSLYSRKKGNRKLLLKNFFVRRCLRLFPAYYLFIITFFILKNYFSLHIWNNDYNFYFFTYLQNVYYFQQGELNSSFSHLWSLGVEEQFYLFWPFLLLLVKQRWLGFVFFVLIMGSVVLNELFQNSIPVFRILTFANLHTLGIGALLAWVYSFHSKSTIYNQFVKFRYLLWTGSLFVLILYLNLPITGRVGHVFIIEFSLMLATGSTVLISIIGWPNLLGFIFNNKFLHHVGKVSYGIYLYHMLIPVIISILIIKIPALNKVVPDDVRLKFLFFVVISYLFALISYYLFEKHFLKLKTKFI